jgi:hypothetical protein
MRGWCHDLAVGAARSYLYLCSGLPDGRSRMIEYLISMAMIISLIMLAFLCGYWAGLSR